MDVVNKPAEKLPPSINMYPSILSSLFHENIMILKPTTAMTANTIANTIDHVLLTLLTIEPIWLTKNTIIQVSQSIVNNYCSHLT